VSLCLCLTFATQEDIGHVAINDGCILESAIYKLLKRHFRSQPYYVDLLELMHEVPEQEQQRRE
jgi:farnesyl diphosphate synthase